MPCPWWYMDPSIIPLMWCSCPVPLAEKHPKALYFHLYVWRWGWCSWGHRQYSSSSSKHGELSWCQRDTFWSLSSDHNTFTHFSSESLANFRWACISAFLRRGILRVLQDLGPSRCSVLPIVFLVTMVPAALRSLTRSSRVVLGWFLTVFMIIEIPRGEILHGVPDRGRLTVILCFFHLPIIAHQLLLPSHQAAWWWSYSPFQPCIGLQSCPCHPWTARWSWSWWRVWNLIDWMSFSGFCCCYSIQFNSRLIV